MNYIEEQQYYNAIKQIQYYQAIKDHYDLVIQEERAIQGLDYLKRYANEVVYPAIEAAKKTKEESIRTKEQLEKSKQNLRDLKNALKLYHYNKYWNEAESRLEPEYVDADKKQIKVTISRSLPPWLEER